MHSQIHKRLWLLVSAFFILSITNCKKETASDDCNSGGVIQPNVYQFWVNQNFNCTTIVVEVKDSQGNKIQPINSSSTTIIDQSAPACNTSSYSQHASFYLFRNQSYTYKATCTSTGRIWNGSIDVPCIQLECRSVLLQ
jgi:hypothetical protein